MICPCGGECRSHEVKAGTVVTCNACGRRETFKRRADGEAGTPATSEQLRAWAIDNDVEYAEIQLRLPK